MTYKSKVCSKDFENVPVLRFSHTMLTVIAHHSKNIILLFCNRLKTLKKEIKMAEQEAEDRKKKKQEMTKSSAKKPKRLSKHQYPTLHVHVLCTPPCQRGMGKGIPGEWVKGYAPCLQEIVGHRYRRVL